MKANKKWKDPIEEVRWVRAKLAKEMEEDPKGFHQKMRENALKSGLRISNLKPISLTDRRERKKRNQKKNGR